MNKEVKPWSQGWLIAAGAYPGFCSIKRLEVFLLPLDGMLVHRRSLPRNFVRFPQQIAGTHLYTWVERGTVRVKCLAQEHNTLSPVRARTRTAHSGVERTWTIRKVNITKILPNLRLRSKDDVLLGVEETLRIPKESRYETEKDIQHSIVTNWLQYDFCNRQQVDGCQD